MSTATFFPVKPVVGPQIMSGSSVVFKSAYTALGGGAYTANDVVGDLVEFPTAARRPGGTGVIQSLGFYDLSNQKTAFTLILFSDNPSGSTFTNNGTVTIAAADTTKILGIISVAAGDYTTFDSKAYGWNRNLGALYGVAGAGTSLYGVVVTTGTPTYAAVSDFQFWLGCLLD